MKWAWIENDKIRDICQGGNPKECYHADFAGFYDTQVPDDAVNGDGWVNGQLVKPVAPPPSPPPPRTWSSDDIRSNLTLTERVKWDNDQSDFIKTVKIELASPKELAATTEILQMLVDAGDISQTSMAKILA